MARESSSAGLLTAFRQEFEAGAAPAKASLLLLAFSGGLDSTVLLHLLATLRGEATLPPLKILHVHHGLQAEADGWLEHCRQLCLKLDLEFVGRRASVGAGRGESPEAAARRARYRIFTEELPPGGMLLQAHHLDDQAETMLLHLLRGSGPRGLAGIPVSRPLGAGTLFRPLLRFRRETLRRYAEERKLDWIEDPSNLDPGFDRNYLRLEVLPALREHWPAMAEKLSLSARLCGESAELERELARIDLEGVQGETRDRLALSPLRALTEPRQRNLLRYWAGTLATALGGAEPTQRALEAAVRELLPAAADREPLVAWGEGAHRLELRRYRDELYLLKPPGPLPPALDWDTRQALQLPGDLGRLELHLRGAPVPQLARLQVRFRQGGESIRMAGRPNKTLKNFLQELGLPPWQRDRVPLLYLDGRLVAVADLAYSEFWTGILPVERGGIRWRRADLHC